MQLEAENPFSRDDVTEGKKDKWDGSLLWEILKPIQDDILLAGEA